MAKLKVLLHGSETHDLHLDERHEYTAGRGENCDIVLGDHPGISRQHFRVYFNGDSWAVEVLSKFGTLHHDGRTVGEVLLADGVGFELPPYGFLLKETKEAGRESGTAPTEEDGRVDSQPKNELAHYIPRTDSPTPTQGEAPDGFEGNEEPTFIGTLTGRPYIRILSDGGQQEKVYRLEGNCWLAGRDDSSEIPLPDMKASRRQFEIAFKSGTGYLITDLGSANGTILNGTVLQANETAPLNSGDVISVNSLILHFEIRDPNFKEKINALPAASLHHPALIANMGGGMVQMPLEGPGGVIRIDGNGANSATGQSERKKRIRIMAAAVTVLILVAVFFSDDEKPTFQNQKSTQQVAFEKLTSEQKQFIRDTYVLAQNLVIQQKWELVLSQVEKIHKLLPEGFEESKKLEDLCREYFQTKQQSDFVKAQIEKEKQARAKVLQVLSSCERIANTTDDLNQLRSCLAPALELDPGNETAALFISRIEQRLEASRLRDLERREHQARIRTRAALCSEGDELKNKGQLLEAIKAHQKCINSGLPDPEGLQDKAQREIASIRQTIEADVQKHLSNAQSLYQASNLKEAENATRQALKVDPDNSKAKELQDRIRRELTVQVKAMYSDSVLEESLGNIEAAKEKWRKIIEIDRDDGDYYMRAMRKLRQYGSL